jgi:hypothetical protein
MDKIIAYKQAVRKVVSEIGAMVPSDENVETQIIMDDERGHYLLFSVGWENKDYREYSPFVHIDVKPTGKVWIQHDGTDLKIALLLVDEGIPKSDIVLGFRPLFRRDSTQEFAVS